MPERPTLAIHPAPALASTSVSIEGTGWPDCPVHLALDQRSLAGHRTVLGFPHPAGVRPDAAGRFLVRVDLIGVEPGTHRVEAHSSRARAKPVDAALEILPMPERNDAQGRQKIGPFRRFADFADRRFSRVGHVPAGLRRHQVEEVGRRRALDAGWPSADDDDVVPALPVPGACNWTPVGPSPMTGSVRNVEPPFSGRALAIAIDPVMRDTMYLGTANGGVWKTEDGGATWAPKTDHEIGLACGAIAIDPRDRRRIFAGTGEFSAGGPGTYYGNGILRSTDGGDSWTLVGSATFERDEITRILFDPTDPTSTSVFAASATGVYQSVDGGDNWDLVMAGATSDLVAWVDPADGRLRLIAGRAPGGIFTATRTAGVWSAFTQVFDPGLPVAVFGRIALAQHATAPRTIYALFAGMGNLKGLSVTHDGGSSWTRVPVRLNTDLRAVGSPADGHSHSITIPAAHLTAAPVARTYTTTGGGTPAHTHAVSLTAAQVEAVAQGETLIIDNDVDATGHAHGFYCNIVWQATYNLAVAVDPSDPLTLYLGEVSLWRSRTGGGVFHRITSGAGPAPDGSPTHTHADQHAILPVTDVPGRVWLANDGGIFRSDDYGTTWLHRNRGLATLQYLHASTHPRWETVMLGGTQDNGTQRFLGSPAWERSAGGDGGFTAFDPADPFRAYHGYLQTTFYQSDDAGRAGTWTAANAGITGRAMSYPPFLLDLHEASVCWFGTTRLWRRGPGGTWSAVTTDLDGMVSALGADPSTPDRVYVATDRGRVYRVQRTGPTWMPSDVVVRDLTAPPLPVGVGISDLAVDSAGTVWATISLIWGAEGPGEFSSRHVFRLPAGTSTWQERSDGLVEANPVNTIVVDPADDRRLFCGADVGVFRTENAGDDWQPWDHGLPNSPVFHLDLHGPSRLLRAATHGRGIWERPIDGTSCADVDLYVRDNILDSGRRRPSPSNEPSPIERGRRVHWWHCADIKVDAPEPDYQTTDPITDFLDFATLTHRTARRDEVNRFYAQVHNRGPFPATRVRARAFFTAATAGLPPLPPDFWTGGRPFDATPVATDWTPVGPTREMGTLEPGVPALATWEWRIPDSAAAHSCLLLVVTCDEDPLALAGVVETGWVVLNDKRVGLRNLQVEDAVAGRATGAMMMELRAPKGTTDLVVDWGDMPAGTTIRLVTELIDGKRPWRAAALRKRGFARRDRKKGDGLPRRATDSCGSRRTFDPDVLLEAERGGPDAIGLTGLTLPKREPFAIAFHVVLPRDTPSGTYQMDVLQSTGKEIVGGSGWRFVVKKPRGR